VPPSGAERATGNGSGGAGGENGSVGPLQGSPGSAVGLKVPDGIALHGYEVGASSSRVITPPTMSGAQLVNAPVVESRIVFCPPGLTRRKRRSLMHVWLRPFSVTFTSAIRPGRLSVTPSNPG